MLHLLLADDRNLTIYHRKFKLAPILTLFKIVSSNIRLINLYDATLGLFELCIDGIRRELFPEPITDLQYILDFVFTLDLQNPTQINARIIIDCLSILAIHVLSENNQSSLLNKMLTFDLVPLSMMLLSKEQIEIREYALKFLQLLLLKSPDKFMAQFLEVGGFNIFGVFLLNPRSIYAQNVI
jgi:hypothetical protein